MSNFEFIISYAVIWWLVLFMVLPVGIRTPKTARAGHSTGAPEKPRLRRKLVVTTVLAFPATMLLDWVITSGLIEVRP